MKKSGTKKRIAVWSAVIIFTVGLLLASISAADVAYIYKNKAAVDTTIVQTLESFGLSVALISEKNMPSDFSQYKFIFIGDERLSQPLKIPVNKVPTVITNYYYGKEFGLTDSDGVSKLAASSPLSVKKGSEIIQVYTKARYNGVSVPYYFLATENKVPLMKTVAGTYTGDNVSLGDVISYAQSGITMLNGKKTEKNVCFFGIVESKFWTEKAKQLFKECTEFVGVACKSNADCPQQTSGSPYCEGEKVYQDVKIFQCTNPGSFNAQCVDDVEKKLLKECASICQNGACICRDQDHDGYDECNPGNPGDDGKPVDCNDNDSLVHPSANEVCDGKDNDCDGQIDEGSSICSTGEICLTGMCVPACVDKDHDGYDTCNIGAPGDDGKKIDCNDNDNKIYPGAQEICDGKDNDCDGQIDEGSNLCGSGSSCVLGTCQNIRCAKEADCGIDGFIDGLFCSTNNDVHQNYVDWTCENPGSVSSSCSKKVEPRLVTDCPQKCQNGACVSFVCDDDSDCNDNNTYTKDKCTNPGAPTSYCTNIPIKCLTNSDCNDNDHSTKDSCINPGTTNSFCSYDSITCSQNSDCGTDGFFDGLFCDGAGNNDVYQNYRRWTCENPGSVSSSCTQIVESKLVTDCAHMCSQGACVSFVCDDDSDCNDNNPTTIDQCNKGGTVESYCTHDSITCSKDSDCGTDRFTGGLSCQEKNVLRDFINFTCHNPGNKNSFCTNGIEKKTVHQCMYACSDGTCVRCASHNDCDDGKSTTVDTCRFGGTVDSYCQYQTIQCLSDSQCGTNGFAGTPFCKNGDLYQNYRSWMCKNSGLAGSYCSSDDTDTLIQDCAFGCADGACKKQTQCSDTTDNDNDGLIDQNDPGCWDDITKPSTYNPQLNDESRARVACTKNLDCGADGFVGNNFCQSGDVYKQFKKFTCNNPGTGIAACSSTQDARLVLECTTGEICSNGQCVAVSCSKNSDCGADGFVGGNYCKDGEVNRDFKTYTCNNPGTPTSSCSSSIQPKGVQQCVYGCENNSCKGIPSVQVLSPSNGTTIHTNTFLLDFKTVNWAVKGKGDTHIHFHIDNVPGLNYSDHLMFYNSPHNVVELNFIPGQTSFATWVDENTVRFNNIPNGVHKIRAHLATATHVAPGNLEADVEISVIVSVSTCVDNDYDLYDTCQVGDPGDDGKPVDCNDNDSLVHPNANEVCDGKDNDCDGQIDEGSNLCGLGSSCVLGTCQNIRCVKSTDCGLNGFVGGLFCGIDNGVYQNYKEFICTNPGNVNSTCNSETTPKLIEICTTGKVCSNGQCSSVTCHKNSDCGVDGFVDARFCQGKDVYQNYKSFMCTNPGTPMSSCNSDVTAKLVQNCSSGCSKGQCITEVCTNGIDDDGDGLIDGLVELNPNNGETLFVPKDNYQLPRTLIYNNTAKKFGLTIPDSYGILLSDSGSGSGYVWNVGAPHSPTLTKVCNIFGYKEYTSYDCHDMEVSSIYPNGKCNFHTPQNNYLLRYVGNNFVPELATPKYSKTWVNSITCKNRLSACSDGWDNDGDGKIDMFDDGCATPNDDNEQKHDPDCQ